MSEPAESAAFMKGENAIATVTAGTGSDACAPAELLELVRAFGEPEWRRLRRGALFLVRDGRAGSMAADDLLQEALTRAFEGRRRCPRGLDPATFVGGIMRSMVSAERDAVEADARPTPIGYLGGGGVDPSSDAPSPERRAISSIDDGRTLGLVLAAIQDVPLLVRLADAVCDGLTGAELEQRLGLTTAGLDAARRRLRRRTGEVKRAVREKEA